MLKKILTLSFLLITITGTFAQKKYNSLLWEISGNGLKKPSYLYGTMHVSEKVAFHLSDTFFIGIKNCQVVALESNPETWMKEMYSADENKANLERYYGYYGRDNNFDIDLPRKDDYERMLRTNPAPANHILYRFNSYNGNHEEDTYLDMFIFQCGKKLKKQVVNLEDHGTTMKLLRKATEPLTEEEEKEEEKEAGNYDIPYNYYDGRGLGEMIVDAYRAGDLDLLDSLETISYRSKKFRKYFIDERNIIMANRMDSILKNQTMFTGVGAAHLPGKMGMIELLRAKGYTVRPVKFSAGKESKLKSKIDDLKYEVTFKTFYPKDSLFSVDAPGSLDKLAGYGGHKKEYFYPDVANGSYYSAICLHTSAPFFNISRQAIHSKIDSLLYENIPGKILKKTEIKDNGTFSGFDITSRTRRGDMQRTKIFVTNQNVYFFRMNGTGDYVKGKEAERFFSSIKITELNKAQNKVTDITRHYEASMPGVLTRNGDNDFRSFDVTSGNYYFLGVTTDPYQYQIEEDTFMLNIFSEEYLKNKDYILKSRKLSTMDGKSILDAEYSKGNDKIRSRFIIEMNKIYVLTSKYNKAEDAEKFIQSLKFNEYKYKNKFELYTDTSMFFTVNTEKDTAKDKAEEELYNMYNMYDYYGRPKKSKEDLSYQAVNLNKVFTSPSTGESIYVSYRKFNDYEYHKHIDSLLDRKNAEDNIYKKSRIKFTSNNGVDAKEILFTDTNSTKGLLMKSLVKHGRMYYLYTMIDTTKAYSKFVSEFFNTFTPTDTLIGKSPFVDKTEIFMKNLMSSDTSLVKQVLDSKYEVATYITNKQAKELNQFMLGTAFPKMKPEQRYAIIGFAGLINKPETVEALSKLYDQYTDSTQLQFAILNALSQIQHKDSYAALGTLLAKDAPLTESTEDLSNLFQNLNDSLELSKSLFPKLLVLTEYEEYKDQTYDLLARLTERELIKPEIYAGIYKRVLREATNDLKRKMSSEETPIDEMNAYENYSYKNYNRGYNSYRNKNHYNNYYGKYSYLYEGMMPEEDEFMFDYNDLTTNYAFLLAPFYKTDKDVVNFFKKASKLKGSEYKMKYDLILLRNNVEVPDSSWNKYVKDASTRVEFIRLVNLMKKNINYDKSYADSLSIAKAIASENSTQYDYSYLYGKQEKEKDTLIFLNKKEYTVKGNKKLVMYTFKYEGKNEYNKAKSNALKYVIFEDGGKNGIPAVYDSGTIHMDKDDKIEEALSKDARKIRFYGHSNNYIFINDYEQNYMGYEMPMEEDY